MNSQLLVLTAILPLSAAAASGTVIWSEDFESYELGGIADASVFNGHVAGVYSSGELPYATEIDIDRHSDADAFSPAVEGLRESCGQKYLHLQYIYDTFWFTPFPAVNGEVGGFLAPEVGASVNISATARFFADGIQDDGMYEMPVVDDPVYTPIARSQKTASNPKDSFVYLYSRPGLVARVDDKLDVWYVEDEIDESPWFKNSFYVRAGVERSDGTISDEVRQLLPAPGAESFCDNDLEWGTISIRAVNDGSPAGLGFEIRINGIRAVAAQDPSRFRALSDAGNRMGVGAIGFYGMGEIDNIAFANGEPEEVSAMLEGASDARLAEHLTTIEDYAAYCEWAQSLRAKGDSPYDVKRSPNAWLSFALGADALVKNALSSNDIHIASFSMESSDSGEGSGKGGNQACKLAVVVSIDGVNIGGGMVDEAILRKNLAKVLAIEGSTNLKDFSADGIDIAFESPANGNARLSVTPPANASDAFFMRARVE